MKESKNDYPIEHIEKPSGITNSPYNMIPHLPDIELFFDSRHWTYGTDILPFSLTTRISANNQQFLKVNMADQNAIELPSELKGKKFRIRKLTPRECFRLMGVDDKDIDKIQAAGVSNSGQYKLAGNSIVVDVLFHIFRKMFIETEQDFDGTPTQLTLF